MFFTNFTKITSSIMTALFGLSICISVAEGINMAVLPYPAFQKGVCYVTWSQDGFASPASDESLRTMADAHVNSVAIVPTWYQDAFNSTEMKPTERTPSDGSIRHVIRKAREYGISVMLKPHIDLIHSDGNTRADIGFQDEEKWKAWFANYLKFITRYARIAEEEKAEFFCIGTELSFAARRKDEWRKSIIPAVRKHFSGQITYAANWDDYKDVEFWGDVDYIGVDAYFPLSEKDSPSVEDLKEGWKRWVAQLEALQKETGRPVLFTECGYASSDCAAAKPWEDAMTGAPNTALQADCYRALFETFWGKSWFAGMYWWNWNTYPRSGGDNNRSFTPQNKPALEYMKFWFSQPAEARLMPKANAQFSQAAFELESRLAMISAMSAARRAGEAGGPFVFTGERAGGPNALKGGDLKLTDEE